MATPPRIIDPRYDGAVAMRALVVTLASGERGYLMPCLGVPTDGIGYPTIWWRLDASSGDAYLYFDPVGDAATISPVDAGTVDLDNLSSGTMDSSADSLPFIDATDSSSKKAAIDLMLSTFAAAVVDVANDSLAIVDADDSSKSKIESIADIVAAMAGTGLTAGSGQFTVNTSDSSTATVTEDAPSASVSEFFVNPAAAAANVIAQIAGGADIDETTWGNITQADFTRTLQVDASALWDGGDIGVTGLWSDGTYEEKTLTATPGAIVESTYGIVPGTISRVRNLAASSAGTCDVQTGPSLAIQTHGLVPTLVVASETSTNGVDGAATIAATGVLTLSAAPNGALDWRVFATLANAYTDAGHTHAFS